jgi:IclR family acetate operon transcriptional repressor
VVVVASSYVPRDLLSRAFEVLEELIANEGRPALGPRELAKRLNLPPASAHRALAALEQRGLAVRRPDGYALGVAWWRLASETMARMPVASETGDVMREVARETGEGVVFSLYDRSRRQLIYAAVEESKHPVRHVVPLNEWLPLHVGASGLAILAFLPEPERRLVLDEADFQQLTAFTITDRAELERELERVRATGYAYSHGQRVAGARSVAAPVWGDDEVPRGSLMVSGPESRVDAETRTRWARLVVDAATSLTLRLGGRQPSDYGLRTDAAAGDPPQAAAAGPGARPAVRRRGK